MNKMERIKALRAQKKELDRQIAQLSDAEVTVGNVRVQVSRWCDFERYNVGVFINSGNKRHWATIIYAGTSAEVVGAIREVVNNLTQLADEIQKEE